MDLISPPLGTGKCKTKFVSISSLISAWDLWKACGVTALLLDWSFFLSPPRLHHFLNFKSFLYLGCMLSRLSFFSSFIEISLQILSEMRWGVEDKAPFFFFFSCVHFPTVSFNVSLQMPEIALMLGVQWGSCSEQVRWSYVQSFSTPVPAPGLQDSTAVHNVKDLHL